MISFYCYLSLSVHIFLSVLGFMCIVSSPNSLLEFFILFLMDSTISKANLKDNFFLGNGTNYTSFVNKINHFFFSVFNLFVLVMLSSFYQKVR